MMRKSKFLPQAKIDLKEIYAYYVKIDGENLADRFYSDFMRRLAFVVANPDLGSLRYINLNENKKTRFIKLRKFPYLIFYSYLEKKRLLEVSRIFHEKRNFLELI